MKIKNQIISIFSILIIIFSSNFAFSQPAEFAGDINSWATPTMNDRSVVKEIRLQASVDNVNSGFKLRSSGSWSPQWCGSNTDYARNLNSRLNGKAFYSADGGGGWEHNLEFNMNNGNYYTFIVGVNSGSNNDMSILETTYNPKTITSVSQLPILADDGHVVTVTATLSGALNSGEYAFVRYSTDGWTSSSLLAMSLVSGSNYSATIPIQSLGTSVSYYVLTSNNNTFTSVDADYFSLELDNNSGSNYSYTVDYYSTAQNGDWNTAATWTANAVPPADAYTKILHAVTINASVSNNPAKINITAGNSITFGASGDVTVNTSITNDGTIDMTNGGLLTIANNGVLGNSSVFTGGTGKIVFAGAGTVSGNIVFNNVDVKGAVDFGVSASINGILSINGGNLSTNSITYNPNSILRYDANYTVNSGDKSWYSNVGSSGSAQEGVPWNVDIPTGISVTLNDSYSFSINGNVTINGDFTLGTDGGSHWGDFFLRGNFTLNSGATFTHNSRSVKFNGTVLQNINGTQEPTFAYLEIDNSAGLQLAQNITVANQVTFTNGKITLGDYNASLGTSTISGNDANKYFITNGIGYLIRNVATAEIAFPVGIATNYAPAFLTQASTQEDLYVRVKQGIDNSTLDDDFIVNLQWTIDEQTTGSNSITTKFQWNSGDENIYFDNSSNVKVARYISGAYTVDDASVAGNDPYTASVSGMTDDISAEIPFVVGNTIAFSANGYKTAQNGDWNTASTWVGGAVPPVNAECYILHHVTIGAITNDANAVTIYADKSLTMNASASLAINGKMINNGMLKTNDNSAILTVNGILQNKSGASVNMVGDGTIAFSNTSVFDNQGSFTSGIGVIDFLQDGSASGNLPFHNINIAGNVDLGTNASIDGTLKLTSSGNLINNSIKYATGSLLEFDRNFSLADDKIWFRNTASTGVEQFSIPWNVQINATYTVDISDAYYRAINGKITIDGTFNLSTSANGDFKLRGDFVRNGTFNNNGRSVEFNGITQQKVMGTSVNFGYLSINNSANVLMTCNTFVNNDLTFLNGKIILENSNLSVTGTITGSSSSMYAVTNGSGYLIQNVGVSSSKVYPVGTLSAYYPANLSQGGSATADNLGVRVQNSIDNTVDDPTQIVNIQWSIDEANAGGNDLTTNFQWNGTDEASGFSRSGTVETRYFSTSYLPAIPTASTVGGAGPYNATAGDVYTGNLSNLPFIVANTGAFSGGIYTIANGNWSASATWNGGTVPATGQCAVVKHNVTLDVDPIVKALSVASVGILSCGSHIITLDNGGAIANSGTFTAGTGKVVFSGTGTISTGSITFNNVDLNGAVSFGSNTAIGGIMNLNAGGAVNVNPPVYNVGSTLKYNQGGNISRADEWKYNISETDPGYPANVQISNNTTFDVDADANDDFYYQTRAIKGNLTIDLGSSISLGDMGGGTSEDKICGVYVKGNIVNNGTITLSSNFGGDMMLEGDITSSGSVGWNSRAVFFTGANTVNQNITGLATIPFILITNGSNVILNNNITVNGSGTEFITFARPSSEYIGSIDLNGNTLTCSGDGNIELNDLAGAQITGTGRVEVSGGNATFSGTNSGTLEFGTNVTLAINGGTMTFPSSLGIVTVYGTLEIGDGATITNIPTYGNNSTLHYKKGGSYTMGVEWGTGSDIADNIPFNITVSQGSLASVLNMNKTRYALGTLLIENSATLEVAEGTGQLSVNNLTVDAGGKIVLKSPNDNGVAGSFISTGTVTNNGTMQAERYIPAGKYVFVSPPNNVTNSQLFTNNANGDFNPNFLSYNQAFEAPVVPNPATGTYAEWNLPANSFKDAWIEAHDGEGGAGILLDTPGKGYAYFNNINKMFVFDGTFNSGDKDITVTFDANDGNSDYFDGWNLIANPFPSALDWDDVGWDKTYVDASIYYWDGTSGTGGNYKYYVASIYDDGTNVINGGSQYIPASQAFFVKAKNTVTPVTGEIFTIPNAARKHNTQDFWSKSSKKSKNNISQFVRIQANANGLEDEFVARFINEGTTGYDGQYDAYKVYSSIKEIPQIYSYNELIGAGYALNSLPLNSLNNKLPLGIEIAKRGTSNCSIKLSEFNITGKHIYLEDKSKKSIINLRVNTEYNYTIADSSDVRDRFEIYFADNHAPIASLINDKQSDWSSDFNFSIPLNNFTDEDAGDVLTYEVKLANGDNLPGWISFNSETLNFSGNAKFVGNYDINIVATDLLGSTVSQSFIFNINAILPELQTNNAENITSNSVSIGSTLQSNGGENLTSSGMCWSINSNPTISDNYNFETYFENEFSSDISGLTENTLYYARSFAENSAGIIYGNEISFTTSAVGIIYFEGKNISFYPNPVKDILFVNSNNSEIKNVNISDISGKIIKIVKFEENEISKEINLQNFTSGIYFIKIVTEDSNYTEKFVVE